MGTAQCGDYSDENAAPNCDKGATLSGGGANTNPNSHYNTGDEFHIKMVRVDEYNFTIKIYDTDENGTLLHDLSNTI